MNISDLRLRCVQEHVWVFKKCVHWGLRSSGLLYSLTTQKNENPIETMTKVWNLVKYPSLSDFNQTVTRRQISV